MFKFLVEKHEETRPFVRAYHADEEDEDEEFRHLREDEAADNDAECKEDDEDEDDVPRETVSAATLQQQLRDAARHKVSSIYERSAYTLNIFAGH